MTTWRCAGCGKVWQAEEAPAECACGCRLVRAAEPTEAKAPEAGSSAADPNRMWVVFVCIGIFVLAAVAVFAFRQEQLAELERRVREEAARAAALPRQAGEIRTVDLGGGVRLELAWCPPGTFRMGSPESEANRDDDEPIHQVTLTKGFLIGKHEVTQAQWEAVMGNNPSGYKGSDLPVETVSWNDCQEFCRRLNARVSGGGFRLPTEAEWEYACRAGTTTPFCYGDRLDSNMANFDGNRPYGGASQAVNRRKTVPVGSFQPNAWGLYDMHGNVLEWCSDWNGGYSAGAVVDPSGASSGSHRVFRGGSWYGYAQYCRSAYHSFNGPSARYANLGFRLARTLP